MSLMLSLNTALSGLNVNQQALAVLSQNIANANTAGYSRKVVNQQAQYVNGQGTGVSVDSIARKVNDLLLQSIRGQHSSNAHASTVSDYFDRTQLMLGNPGSNNTISYFNTNFFNNLHTLSQSPEDSTAKFTAVQAGVSLTQQLNQLAQNLQDQRFQADQDIALAVNAVNDSLKQIYSLNATISQQQALGNSASELEDRRDARLNEVAQYLNIQTFVRQNGAINISIGGVSLVDDNLYQLSYNQIGSSAALANDAALSPLNVYRADENGNRVGQPIALVSGGKSADIVSGIISGKIKGLIDIRDRQIPRILDQLDMYAATLRDEMNAVHNAGSGFPGANSYTGTRAVTAQDVNQWSGKVRIGLTSQSGTPVISPYETHAGGFPPLTLDLALLNTGGGAGYPSLQGIIDEINSYFGSPQNKVQIGNLSNIRLASNSSTLPGVPPQFSFDLDLENLSAGDANIYVTDIQVLDSDSNDITSISQNVPDIDISDSNSFVTANGSNIITINTSSAHGLSSGDTIYLPDITAAVAPAGDLNNIPLSELNDQFFTITNVTASSFQITVSSNANADGPVDATGAAFLAPYASMSAGESGRTTGSGAIVANLSGNTASPYYTITLDVAVDDGDGNISQTQVTYRVDNSTTDLLNSRYSVSSVSGDGELVVPSNSKTLARAILVDADGRELPKVNGKYIGDQQGYLKILANNSAHSVVMDSLNSAELGAGTGADATNRGFSHYFNLNNFFTSDGNDVTAGSALNLQITQRLIDNPNLISTGVLSLIPAGSGETPTYSYELLGGDNTIAQRLASLGLNNISFDAAGGVGATQQTFANYSSQIIGAASSTAAAAKSEAVNARVLLEGYIEQESSISGVNLDEELAYTVIYQNAYTASARVITVANNLFDTLLSTFQ